MVEFLYHDAEVYRTSMPVHGVASLSGTSILNFVTQSIQNIPRSAKETMASLLLALLRLRRRGIRVPGILGNGGTNLRYLIIGYAAPSRVAHSPGQRCSVKHRHYLQGILDDMNMSTYSRDAAARRVRSHGANVKQPPLDDACAFLAACAQLAFEGCAVSHRAASMRTVIPTHRRKLLRMKARQMERFARDPSYRRAKKQSTLREYDAFLDAAIARRLATPTTKDKVSLLWQFERPAMALFSRDFLIPAMSVCDSVLASMDDSYYRDPHGVKWRNVVKREMVLISTLLLRPLLNPRAGEFCVCVCD